jgi:hypothetical protein
MLASALRMSGRIAIGAHRCLIACNPLQRHQGPVSHPGLVRGQARPDGQPSAAPGDLSRPAGYNSARRSQRRTRAGHGAVGHAGAYPFRRSAGDEHPQPEEPALAALAGTGKSLRRSRDVVLRVRRYETAQDADLVRPCRGTSAVCFPWVMDAAEGRAWAQERAG